MTAARTATPTSSPLGPAVTVTADGMGAENGAGVWLGEGSEVGAGAAAIVSSTFSFTVGRGISGTEAREAGVGAAVGGAPADGSRRNRTVGRGISPTTGFAAVGTATREVSFFASAGIPIMAVSFLAWSPMAVVSRLACESVLGLGAAVCPIIPGGRLMRTVSFFDSSSGMIFGSAMGLISADISAETYAARRTAVNAFLPPAELTLAVRAFPHTIPPA